MDRRLPWALIAVWLGVGVSGWVAIRGALEGHSTALVWTVGLEGSIAWAAAWVAILIPRITTLTAARIGVPVSVAAATAAFAASGPIAWTSIFALLSVMAIAALALPTTIDAFVDGSSYGPERRFALRTPALTALVAVPPTWIAATMIAIVPPLAVIGNLPAALAIGVVWVLVVHWAVRSLHLPARRWTVFVPAGMVLSDPLVLTDRVLFPRRNVEALGPALAETDATDLSQGTLGLALQMDLSVPFALPMIDRRDPSTRDASGERTVTTDRIVFSVLRPGALLEVARERRFTIGETRVAEPQCVHHVSAAQIGEMLADATAEGETQTAVPLPRTRSSR